MTPLEERIRRQIAQTGPMSVADYMTLCLAHPEHGYYATRDPLGVAGDFITAPEISQMFGEMIGLWLAATWQAQGGPSPFILAELGPGRGTLMADALRATKAVPGFHAAARLCLVETSPALRAKQADALAGYAPEWVGYPDALPDGPLFLIANEFFDCLPIRQFVKTDVGFTERMISTQDGKLIFGLAPAAPDQALFARFGDLPEGRIVELCPAAEAIASGLQSRIDQQGGAALIIDYGGRNASGDTLQALRAHQKQSPLETPGEADLTAHVNFAALAPGAPYTTQGTFLERLGITARAQAIAKTLNGAALETHIAAHRRLTHPDEMGSLFKTAALLPKGADAIGFDPGEIA
ncbi:class I SAM-dependent methyltransferase [Paracoccaceae bacterium GXU_MW_L88]